MERATELLYHRAWCDRHHRLREPCAISYRPAADGAHAGRTRRHQVLREVRISRTRGGETMRAILPASRPRVSCIERALVHLTGELSNPTTPVKRLFDAFRRGDFSGREPRERIPTTHRRLKRLSPPDVDQLVREYCDGLGSVYELADRWGVHRNTIAKHLKSRGLELGRLSLTSDEIRRAFELRAQGLSFNAIGRAIGKDPKTVKAALS